MPASVAAAATLVLAMTIATVGTIVQAEPFPAAAEPGPVVWETAGESPPGSWEVSLERALRQTERGLQQMAGLGSPR